MKIYDLSVEEMFRFLRVLWSMVEVVFQPPQSSSLLHYTTAEVPAKCALNIFLMAIHDITVSAKQIFSRLCSSPLFGSVANVVIAFP